MAIGITNAGGVNTWAMVLVNYPSGSTLTATNVSGKKDISATQRLYYVKAPSSGSTQTCVFTITDGTQTKSKTVSGITVGSAKEVTLSYIAFLYNLGDECISLTGGWQTRGWRYDSGSYDCEPSVTKESTYMSYAVYSYNFWGGILETANNIDLTNFSTLKFNISNFSNYNSPSSEAATRSALIVTDRTRPYSSSLRVALLLFYNFVNGDNSLDISSISGEYDIGFCYAGTNGANCSFNINSMWLEE